MSADLLASVVPFPPPAPPRDAPALPRWFWGRAGRLSAALLETLIDAHGHAGARRRFADPVFRWAFARAVGVDLPARLDRPLRAAWERDRARLGFDPDGLLWGTAATPAAAPLDGQRLRALLIAARAPHSGPFAELSRRPGIGPRTGLALALFADLVFAPTPDPGLQTLAVGQLSAQPIPLLLTVFDHALAGLEDMLHRPAGLPHRISPLAALFFETARHVPQAVALSAERFLSKENRHLEALGACTEADGSPGAPPLPRRPRRTLRRLPDVYIPPPLSEAGLARPDLFTR